MTEDERAYTSDLLRAAEGHLSRARALTHEALLMLERDGHPPSPEPWKAPAE